PQSKFTLSAGFHKVSVARWWLVITSTARTQQGNCKPSSSTQAKSSGRSMILVGVLWLMQMGIYTCTIRMEMLCWAKRLLQAFEKRVESRHRINQGRKRPDNFQRGLTRTR